MSDKALKNIFLNEFHLENGAKFVPFAGYEMPINYKKGIINEHLHVREKAGIFDVSHMGQILIPANDKNISSLETYIPLNINNIPSNKCHYSFMLNKKGGIVDDIMMSKININNQENIYIVYNASRKKILNEIFSNICENYSTLKNRCLIAIQGPSSYSVLNSFLDLSIATELISKPYKFLYPFNDKAFNTLPILQQISRIFSSSFEYLIIVSKIFSDKKSISINFLYP